MLAKQRQSLILDGLDRDGEVTVAGLAKRLAVTDETIRRDLAKLAERGRLVRTHGGAVRPTATDEPPFAQRQSSHASEKHRIGRAAAQLVSAGEVIAIDASTTGLEVARQLPEFPKDCPVTVVSNGLDAVRWLADRTDVKVVCTGGEFDAAGACFVGPLAEASLRQFAFQKAFVSCAALDTTRGPSEASLSHAAIKRTFLAMADEAWLVADSSKFGHRSGCYFAALNDFTGLVTDQPPMPEDTLRISEAGLTVHYAIPPA
ncbi:DeoR/GlpR family DNA-binding transcription regulator [Botrimarina hoheduenensis]|uniref:Glucitol operon repressor n=1 Tax=Botrimarina hoheduenensis TaxID=2528000 RepID=A0A5C5VYR1_9BACT|nr:DeoR/GlpR family DNA-binding transcription regulator [Botrimarina hoheduenensis]TWT42889.1 Glucitol operon repressor [Botrimarina hoheduenensis]